MLSALLSSYSGSKHAGIRVDEGALCGIPNVCVHCEKYKVGKCGKGRDGYSVCKYDCVIYEAQKRIWFGLQIKELCSGWRMLRYDRPFLLTKSQFSYLLSYDQQLSLYAEAAAQAVDFSAKYDALIREMLSVLPNFDDGTWDKDLKVTTLSGESLSKLVNALNLLKAKRQSFGALLSIPKFNNILPYVAHGQVNNALILADERCLRCRHKSCSKGEAPIGLQDVSRCPNGVSYVKGF